MATGASLPLRYRVVAWLLRSLYFGRIDVVGSIPPAKGARLVVCSHRNGAIDGYTVLRAFPRAQFLISVQLLRSRLLRWMFTGIPVVRDKDRERYGIQRSAFDDPVDAGCAHLRAGGDLVVFPEGSSEWGYRPLPYQRGAARMACRLLAEGSSVTVLPVGLHYARPDGFRSHVEIMQGPAITLPTREDDEAQRSWENRVHEAIGRALDAVSVNCRSEAQFASVEASARFSLASGESYAEALLAAQVKPELAPPPPTTRSSLLHWLGDALPLACLILSCFPIALAAAVAGSKADARNTVTFFRMVGGFVAGLIWLPLVVAMTIWHPLPALTLITLAAIGWWRYPRMFPQE
nr:1-acyl-sn-glycerol-3-phosphate acyltransferase [Dyella sp. ASV24]